VKPEVEAEEDLARGRNRARDDHVVELQCDVEWHGEAVLDKVSSAAPAADLAVVVAAEAHG
jgi:hypothetical protein